MSLINGLTFMNLSLIGGGSQVLPTTTITSISPVFGPIAGGTSVTINGTNLGSATPATTKINGVAVSSSGFTATSSQITCLTQAMSAGSGTVQVGTSSGLKFYALAGMVADLDSATYPNNGSQVTGDGIDNIGGLHDVATGSPGWLSGAVGGKPVITYNGTSQDHQMGTLVRAQPLSVFYVMSQITSTNFAYILGGSNTTIGDQLGSSGNLAGLAMYAGLGPIGNNTDLPLSAYGIVEWHFAGSNSAIQVGDGTRATSLASGTNGLTAGRGRAAYIDHSGRTKINVAREIIANTSASGYSGSDFLAALQLNYEPWPIVVGGTSIEGGYGLGQGQIDPWPMQLCALTGNLFPVNPGVVWSASATTRQVGTPSISKNFGYPGAPYDGVHPNTASTINADGPTEDDLAIAAMVGRGHCTYILGAPTNDISFGATLANCQSRLSARITLARLAWVAAGGLSVNFKVIVMTNIARTWLTDGFGTAAAKETVRLAYNTDVLANFVANYGADACANPALTLNDATNATYYQTPDPGGNNGIHPTRAGATVLATSVQSVINSNGWHA